MGWKLPLRRITRDEYDKKLKDYKEKQHDIALRLEELTNADENYHITAATLFSLANRALEIFESSEVNEKRQLLNFLLQNCRLSGKNLAFELRSPFGMMLEYAHHPSVLAWRDSFRTFEWERVIPSPKGTLIQMGQLLAIPAVF